MRKFIHVLERTSDQFVPSMHIGTERASHIPPITYSFCHSLDSARHVKARREPTDHFVILILSHEVSSGFSTSDIVASRCRRLFDLNELVITVSEEKKQNGVERKVVVVGKGFVERRTLYVGLHPRPKSVCVRTIRRIIMPDFTQKWGIVYIYIRFFKGSRVWAYNLLIGLVAGCSYCPGYPPRR